MNEPTGKAFEIDRRYERMRSIEDIQFTRWDEAKYGLGGLLLLLAALLVPALLIYSLL